MALQLQIVVVTEHTLVPLYGLASPGNISIQDLCGNLTGNTGRTDDQSFVELLQIGTVGTGAHIMTIHPRTTHQLDQVLVTLVVLGQYDEVVTTHV